MGYHIRIGKKTMTEFGSDVIKEKSPDAPVVVNTSYHEPNSNSFIASSPGLTYTLDKSGLTADFTKFGFDQSGIGTVGVVPVTQEMIASVESGIVRLSSDSDRMCYAVSILQFFKYWFTYSLAKYGRDAVLIWS